MPWVRERAGHEEGGRGIDAVGEGEQRVRRWRMGEGRGQSVKRGGGAMGSSLRFDRALSTVPDNDGGAADGGELLVMVSLALQP